MPVISANGTRFHVQRLSAARDEAAPPGTVAPAVVFVHGLLIDNLSSFYYTLAGPVAIAGARALMYDLRGHGRSDRPPGGYSVAGHVADLRALLDALDVTEPAYLVGNSFGGLVAARMAVAAPERVAGLALIDASCAGPRSAAWLENILNTLAAQALRLEHDPGFAGRHRRAGQRRQADSAETVNALLNETSLIEDLAAEQPLDLADLAGLGCPVLGIFGEHSDLRDSAEDLREHVPASRVEIVPGAAHYMLADAPGLVRAAVLDWLPFRKAIA
ncbi:MAG TPA: alpha/beta hydrolase [Trebonia sp.]|jgi:pimeloyl-ACP methyl ester carboxylesterase|nr:alpha/beta hydrolase [Trebonia sp.]